MSSGRRVVVGVNAYTEGNEEDPPPTLRVGQEVEDIQLKRLADVRQARSADAVETALVTDDVPIVRFVEAHGLDVSYVTDPDLDRGVSAVSDARALVFGSHTEYWTTGMRTNLEAALARGANAVFLGANNMYWRPVPVGSTRPYRELSIWKIAALDPNADNPQLASLQWRQEPINQPEQAVLARSSGAPTSLSR